MSKRLVVVGGVAAGMTAATHARRTDPDLEIAVYERSGFVSYGACGFPYFISGEISHIQKLLARSVEQFSSERIDVHVRHEVTALNPGEHTLTVFQNETGQTFTTHWDKLILATGVQANRLPLPGGNLAGIFPLRTVEDALAIKTWLVSRQPRHAVVIGGSSLGLEMAEALQALGLETTLVEKQEQILYQVDPEIAAQVQATLRAQGINLRLGETITSFIGAKLVNDITLRAASLVQHSHAAVSGISLLQAEPFCVREVVLRDEVLPADIVLLCLGGRPNTALASPIGLSLDEIGTIAVDNQQRTNLANIWAAGGACGVYHRMLGKPIFMPTALNANKQGRVAGINAAGGQATFNGTVAAAVVRIFGQTLAHTGLTEKEALRSGLDARSVTITSWSRAAYMPSSTPVHIKLVFEKDSQRVLGAQMLGQDSIAKRIDVVSAALQAGWTLADLSDLDTTYTPTEAPVWESLLIAANVGRRTNGDSTDHA